jgi:acyl-ACP thioesterase
MSVYQKQLRLRNKDVNLHRRLRTARLFELMQEASIRHTEELGMGREKTLDRGLLWVVTLQRAEIARMPEYDETVTLESWPGRTMHLLFPRYYRVLDGEGRVLLRASALWALIDQNTRRMVFPDDYGIEIEGQVTGEEIALPSPLPRAEGELLPAFRVPYSYLDLNGHMNNTRYFDLAEDRLAEAARGDCLRELAIEYANEARLGDELELRLSREEGLCRLSGDCGKKIFRLQMRYEQASPDER